jgi:peroxiredoxin
MITEGSRLPDATFRIITDDGPAEMPSSEVFAGKTVLLFAVPGAFTPTCNARHLPGYIEHHDAFKALGVDVIACTSVNDPFVMGVWQKSAAADGRVLFLADGNGDFARATGLHFDASMAGLGVRSKRYAMLVRDGVVEALRVEDAPGGVSVSGADEMLKLLQAHAGGQSGGGMPHSA